MTTKEPELFAVPTNVITGFLGVGKTTAIMHLLSQKPSNERWAILVNEFGEIGLDRSLLVGLTPTATNVFTKEVSGGCMCCASKVSMQVALNQLLSEAKPDRLLIEPTGIGHPKEVLELLSADHFKKVIRVDKTVTLVDARQLTSARYTSNETFKQQLELADLIIANKVDMYSEKDKQALTNYLQANRLSPENIYETHRASMLLKWLCGPSRFEPKTKKLHNHHTAKAQESLPKNGVIKKVNNGEGYQSVGWRFTEKQIFNRQALKVFLSRVDAVRVKGVFITSEGVFGYNNVANQVTELALNYCEDSRLEIICEQIDEVWEQHLMNTIERHQNTP